MRDDDTRGMGTLGAAIFGALVGAAAVYLSREDNRKKVRESMENLMNEGERKMDEVHGKVEEIKDKGRRKLARQLETMKQNIEPGEAMPEE